MAYESVTIRTDSATYVADNAATESTLRELLSVTRQASGINTNKANNVGAAFDGLSRTVNHTKKSTEDYSKYVKSVSDDLNVFGQKVSSVGKTLVSLSSGNASASGVLSQFGSVASDVLSGLGSSALAASTALKGTLGKSAGAVGVGLTAAGALLGGAVQGTAAALALVDDFAKSYYRLADSGILVDDSFQSLVDSAAASSMTLDDLAVFVEQNKSSLLAMGGSISTATKSIFKFRQGITTAGLEQRFINLGIKLEDIPDYLADFGAGTRGLIQNMDMTTVAKSTESLAKSQRLLTDLTGKSVDELRNEAQARSTATQVQYKLMQLQQSDPNAYQKYEAAAAMYQSQYGEAGLAAFQDYFANKGFTSQATALTASQIPSLLAMFNESTSAIENNALAIDEVSTITLTAIRSRLDETRESLARLAGILQPLPALEGPLGQFSGELGQMIANVQALSSQTDAQFKTMIEQQNKAADNNDKMVTSIGNVGIAMVGLKTSAQTLLAELTELVGDPASNVFKALADAIKSSIDAIKLSIGMINDPGKTITDMAASLVPTPAEAAGTVAGGYIGGTIGSALGPVGTGAGALIGGFIGNEAGKLYDSFAAPVIADWLNGITNTGTTGGGFATGGISTGPKTGHLELLHGTEAVVPLPDGKSIPVTTSNMDSKAIADLINLTAKNNEIMMALTNLTKESLSQLERSNRLLQQSIYVSS